MHPELLAIATVTARLSETKQLLRERDERIASIIRYKRASITEVMAASGLTKSRIYQVFERVYGFPVREIERRGGTFPSS